MPIGRIRAAYSLPDRAAHRDGGDGFIPFGGDSPEGDVNGSADNNGYARNGDLAEAAVIGEHGNGANGGEERRDPAPYHGVEQERERAHEEGRKAAHAELQQKYEEETEEIRRIMTEFVRSMHMQFDEFRQKSELFVLQFSMAVAEKIVKREAAINKELVLAQIKDAMHKILGVEKIKVLVNPQDEKIVKPRRTDLIASTDSVREMIIEADDKVDRGGCIIESNHGNVDARLLSQLKNIEAALEEKARHARKSVSRKRKK
jgi:flagellar assembly protein FliH